ncbi:hypothetical protein A3L22_30460 [Streptomyces griseus subsp. griseus]|nr:hypothetical protein A3L22_30460 [Streptomyces griseus subsp. griseus]
MKVTVVLHPLQRGQVLRLADEIADEHLIPGRQQRARGSQVPEDDRTQLGSAATRSCPADHVTF